MAFIIKSFHSPGRGLPPRVFFWQTPWLFQNMHNGDWYSVGGWVTASNDATIYPSELEAVNMNAIRRLFGRVEPMRLTAIQN